MKNFVENLIADERQVRPTPRGRRVNVGLPLITDVTVALHLPFLNLPSNARRIRVRQSVNHRAAKFFVRLPNGIQTFVGTIEQKGARPFIKLIPLANGSAFTRPLFSAQSPFAPSEQSAVKES